MAEVLAEHVILWARRDHPTEDRVDFIASCKKCGPLAAESPVSHQAAALAAAGYGPVKTVAEMAAIERAAMVWALRDAEDELENRSTNICSNGVAVDRSYILGLTTGLDRAANLLRTRAAAIEEQNDSAKD